MYDMDEESLNKLKWVVINISRVDDLLDVGAYKEAKRLCKKIVDKIKGMDNANLNSK